MREYNQAHSNRKNSGTESAIFLKNFIAYSLYRWHWCYRQVCLKQLIFCIKPLCRKTRKFEVFKTNLTDFNQSKLTIGQLT